MDKASLRELTIKKLKTFTEAEKFEVENRMFRDLIDSSLWNNAHSIGITISHGIEWDTINIIKKAWEQGKLVYVPKCYPQDRKMVFYQLDDFDQLESVYYNLLEPNPAKTTSIEKNSIDLIVVPGVVFDSRGFRVGFGGGYYDRFLANYKQKTIALLHTDQLINQVPNEKHDIAVDYLLTEKGFLE